MRGRSSGVADGEAGGGARWSCASRKHGKCGHYSLTSPSRTPAHALSATGALSDGMPATDANDTAAAGADADADASLALATSGLGVVDTDTITASCSESESIVTTGD